MAKDTYVELVPSHTEVLREHGRFCLRRSDCIQYLQTQYGSFSIPLDGQLLNWLRELESVAEDGKSYLLPSEYDERSRFIVDQFLSDQTTFDVTCDECGRRYCSVDISQQDWDTSTFSAGIRAGAVGIKLLCPAGHDLLFICTRLF